MNQSVVATITAIVPSSEPGPTIEFAEIPAPEPAENEAVVAVEAFSINRGEFLILHQPPEGWRPGLDVAGRVLRAAADGSGPIEGTRVVGQAAAGSWATEVAVPTSALAALPDAVSAPEAATLGAAGLTALRLLRRAGFVAGQRVLMTGAAGGLGHFFVELAAAQGARVTAVTSVAERAGRLLELGATEVVADVAEAEGPFELVLDAIGGPTLTTAISKVARGGLVLWFGQAGGEPAKLDLYTLGDISMAQIVPFSFFFTGASDADDLATLAGLVESGRLHPEIGEIADWSETPALLARLGARQLRGNAVLTVGPR